MIVRKEWFGYLVLPLTSGIAAAGCVSMAVILSK